MDAFDADVLIYAAVPGHRLGRRVRALFVSGALEPCEPYAGEPNAGVGSVLLVPEILTKPLRDGAVDEVNELGALLGRLTLIPTTEPTAGLAVALGVTYGRRPSRRSALEFEPILVGVAHVDAVAIEGFSELAE